MNTFVMPDRGWPLCNLACAALLLLTSTGAFAQAYPIPEKLLQCTADSGIRCIDTADNPPWKYIGHDEPSLLFYSNTPGSGNSSVYRLMLPNDPPLKPKQDGSGGTWNFQLHPAFWVGMAICADQSAPNPGGSPSAGPNITCVPDSDKNIYDGADPKKKDYIGKHPGAGFMEMQFYPPGWITSNSVTQWTAALNIDFLSQNYNTGQGNNDACGGALEYADFAFIQTDGIPYPPGSPNPLIPVFPQLNANTLLMNPGDELIVTLVDTEDGLKITVQDVTSGQTGFMVASAANSFAEILFDPNGNNCDFATHSVAHDMHPMYATSSEHTRVPWAAHSYNIAFSDEIGHFEYCDTVAFEGGPCTSNAVNDPPGIDDNQCFDAAFAASFGLISIGGCIDSDIDFDGVPYRNNTWPGSLTDPIADSAVHAQPVKFTSPVFFNNGGQQKNYKRVAFENDLPRIETNTDPPCQRFVSNPADPNPGQGCVNPPMGADFYPIFSTGPGLGGCLWQLGGPHILSTTNTFGGTSAAEYGALLPLVYPASNGLPTYRFNDFQQTLKQNPCPASGFDQGDD